MGTVTSIQQGHVQVHHITRSGWQSLAQFAINAGIVVTIFLIPVWHRLDYASGPFSRDYVVGYLIFIPIVWTLLWWSVSGLPGLNTITESASRTAWVSALIALCIWGLASQRWAFVAADRPEVTAGAAVQLGLTILFVLIILTSRLSLHTILVTVAGTMLLHALIGGAQVAQQGSIGLDWLGEFSLNPQRQGVGVIQSSETRWLRPYGLTAHPNIFAGFMMVGLMASLGLALSEGRRIRWMSTLVYGVGLWVLLLTFSRSAWLGFAVACVSLLALTGRSIWRHPIRRRQTGLIIAGTIILSLLFFVLYQPLILVRAGVNNTGEITESRSLNERTIYNQVAVEAIKDNPLLGVGIGNYPWYASHYLFFETDYDMRGDNVHNIYLAVQAELGLIGSLLFVIVIISGLAISFRTQVDKTISHYRHVVVSTVLALLVIGLFDHYLWTMLHFQILLLCLVAYCLKTPPVDSRTYST